MRISRHAGARSKHASHARCRAPSVARQAGLAKVRGIWQRRFWEHSIRDAGDLRRHMDYIHYNPVKHGHCRTVADWPYSTFHRYVALGVYAKDWAGVVDGDVGGEYGE